MTDITRFGYPSTPEYVLGTLVGIPLTPGYLPGYDQEDQVWYSGTSEFVLIPVMYARV